MSHVAPILMYKLSHSVSPFFRDLDPVTIANDHFFLQHLPHHTFHQSPLAVRISVVVKSIIVVAMPKCPVVPHRVSLEAPTKQIGSPPPPPPPTHTHTQTQ